ncbi:hypothetical protein ECFRIK1999_5811, partial [Escherichia coli FRIK1999]
MRDLA